MIWFNVCILFDGSFVKRLSLFFYRLLLHHCLASVHNRPSVYVSFQQHPSMYRQIRTHWNWHVSSGLMLALLYSSLLMEQNPSLKCNLFTCYYTLVLNNVSSLTSLSLVAPLVHIELYNPSLRRDLGGQCPFLNSHMHFLSHDVGRDIDPVIPHNSF